MLIQYIDVIEVMLDSTAVLVYTLLLVTEYILGIFILSFHFSSIRLLCLK